MTREDYRHLLQIALLAAVFIKKDYDFVNYIDEIRDEITVLADIATNAEFGEKKSQRGMAEIKELVQKSTPVFGDE